MSHLRKSSFIFCICFVLSAPFAFAQNTKVAPPVQKPQGQQQAPVQKQKDQKVEKKYDVEDFSYNLEGSRNPFEPIVLLKAKTSRGAVVKASKTSKTSKMKKDVPEKIDYELEELRLVGVIKSEKGMIAMMEDTQGKGIFFRKGDHLNKNMWVMEISNSNIVLGYKSKGDTKKITVDIPKKN